MEKLVRFFKQNNKWYADVPNHTLDENQMVDGADCLLDLLTFEALNEITLNISTEYSEKTLIHLSKKEQDEFGCTYEVRDTPFKDTVPEIWICNVTLDVFGDFPENLYIDIYIENKN